MKPDAPKMPVRNLPQGVAVLHQNLMIHYDLKCDNGMVEVNKKCLGLDGTVLLFVWFFGR